MAACLTQKLWIILGGGGGGLFYNYFQIEMFGA